MSATPLQTGQVQFWDSTNGKPASCGEVSFFEPGTVGTTRTPKDTWADQDQTILNNNPLALDNTGQAFVFGVGEYDVEVRNRCGDVVQTYENVGWLTDGAFPNAGLPDLNI
ncbi:MAG: hypothetical protein ACE5FB_09105 [Candidatus Binatia bacterium]